MGVRGPRVNDDGDLTKREIRKALAENVDAQNIIREIPVLEPLLKPQTMKRAFEAIDKDDDGALDLDE